MWQVDMTLASLAAINQCWLALLSILQMEFIRGGFEVNKVIPGPCRASTLHL